MSTDQPCLPDNIIEILSHYELCLLKVVLFIQADLD